MKVINLEGDWVGLARWKSCVYQIDYFSTPDQWKIGFDIVYRLSFTGDDIQLENSRLTDGFRRAFKKAFGLPDSHYSVEQWGGLSVYWRVYWNRNGFDLRLLDKCEKEIDKLAEKHKVRVTLLEMTIIPRSIEHLSILIGN